MQTMFHSVKKLGIKHALMCFINQHSYYKLLFLCGGINIDQDGELLMQSAFVLCNCYARFQFSNQK